MNSPTKEMLTIDTGAGLVRKDDIKILPIYDESAPLLKSVIPEFTGDVSRLSKLIKQMQMTRKKYNGVGLAANQCGQSVRMFVIGGNDYDMVCINPQLIEASSEELKGNEGCLSFPGLFVKIKRPTWIKVEYINENGNVVQMTFSGITARCYLHELDHLNGIRLIDHVGPTAILLARNKQKKIMKKIIRQHSH
ncbi:peptide deformylase [Candidatus Dojkabacteria bacterium]|jgi:peptide deformylase|nr:peptide deformylase [Candidatus Dojkabacteria bacterium]